MPRLRRVGAAGLLLVLGTLLACSEPAPPAAVPVATRLEQPPPVPPPAPAPVFTGALEPGQTLSEVLAGHNLPEGTVHEIIRELGTLLDMRKLRPGNEYRLELSETGDFRRFAYHLSREQRFRVEAVEGGFKASREEVDIETKPFVIAGTIKTTLIDAVLEQGENINFAMELLNAFQWDINFYTDTQPGDRFEALVEKVFIDGTHERVGRVLVARYEGSTVGQKEAFAFKGDFFDGKGRYLQRSFLTTPLSVLRITSRFGQRFHPILKIHRAHKGIDYGAVRGTPVWSVADGEVLVAGNRGDGYGKQVMIRHAGGYVSRYAHLNRVSLRAGQRVKQKMKVGEVGSTGLASGPHLHFEILSGGRQINPAKLKMLPTVVRSVKNLPEFLAERERLLELMRTTAVAAKVSTTTTASN